MGVLAEGLAIQITMHLIWQRACHRLHSHHTHRETHRALQPRQPRFTLPISTLDPAFLTTCRLLAGTDRPAQPAHPQQPHTARAPAGRRSPTKSTLPAASIDANQAANAPGLGAGSIPAASRPAAPRRRAPAPPSPRSRLRKRHQKSAVERASPSPSSPTYNTAAQGSARALELTGRRGEALGGPPHRSDPAQWPCSSRNRKPLWAPCGRLRPRAPAGRTP